MAPLMSLNGNSNTQAGNAEKLQSSNSIESSNSTGNDQVTRNNDLVTRNEGLLSLKDISIRLETDYGRLRRFADTPNIGELLGAVDVPGAKGVRYEPRAVEVFRRLIQASDAKAVTPATAVAWLTANEARPHEDPKDETAIAQKTQSGNSILSGNGGDPQIGRGLAMILGPVVSIMQEVRDLLRGHPALTAEPAAPQDRLLTPEQAAEILACKPRSVGRHVAPVSESPRRYRESDIFRHIKYLAQIEKTPLGD